MVRMRLDTRFYLIRQSKKTTRLFPQMQNRSKRSLTAAMKLPRMKTPISVRAMFLNSSNCLVTHITRNILGEEKRQTKQRENPRRLPVVWSEDRNEDFQGIGSLFPKPNWVCSNKYPRKSVGIRTRCTVSISPSIVVLLRGEAHKPYGFGNKNRTNPNFKVTCDHFNQGFWGKSTWQQNDRTSTERTCK